MNKENYDLIIQPKKNAFDINFKEIWMYRDLLKMFVKRDIITVYKQTILGPIWFFIQPIFTTVIYMFVFGGIANISTDGAPQALFYLSGITIWNYFQQSFTKTANTFRTNAGIFGKVYFPRLIMPLSQIVSGLAQFLIQLTLFLVVYFYYYFFTDVSIVPNYTLFLIPFYIFLMGIFGLGNGIIFTSLTTKYRDLSFLITFGVQLLMYASPIIYPVSTIDEGLMRDLILLNPFTPILEGFKFAFLGVGYFSWKSLLYSSLTGFIILFIGIVIFHKTEKNFIDTV